MCFAITKSNPPNGIGTIFEGSCETVKNLDTWLHVILNGLATALVGASNYNMQCLASPNRAEVDEAHSKGKWLDIGVPSVRNLRHIALKRTLLWALLAASSVPLHLLWNSVIFSTLQNNEYLVIAVSEDFSKDKWPACDKTLAYDFTYFPHVICEMYTAAQEYAISNKSLTLLGRNECIQAYANSIQSEWSNVFAVLSSVPPNLSNSTIASSYNASSLMAVAYGPSGPWICDDTSSSHPRCNYYAVPAFYNFLEEEQGVYCMCSRPLCYLLCLD